MHTSFILALAAAGIANGAPLLPRTGGSTPTTTDGPIFINNGVVCDGFNGVSFFGCNQIDVGIDVLGGGLGLMEKRTYEHPPKEEPEHEPMPEPTHPMPEPTHPMPEPTHPMPEPTHPMPEPTHPMPEPTHPMPEPTHPMPEPIHPMPEPTHPPKETYPPTHEPKPLPTPVIVYNDGVKCKGFNGISILDCNQLGLNINILGGLGLKEKRTSGTPIPTTPVIIYNDGVVCKGFDGISVADCNQLGLTANILGGLGLKEKRTSGEPPKEMETPVVIYNDGVVCKGFNGISILDCNQLGINLNILDGGLGLKE